LAGFDAEAAAGVNILPFFEVAVAAIFLLDSEPRAFFFLFLALMLACDPVGISPETVIDGFSFSLPSLFEAVSRIDLSRLRTSIAVARFESTVNMIRRSWLRTFAVT